MQTMVRPKGFVEGTVQSSTPKMVVMENGNSFAEFRIWLEPRRKANGKLYRMEVICRIYGENAPKAMRLSRSARVRITGDLDVESTHTAAGKVFANLVMMARDLDEIEVAP